MYVLALESSTSSAKAMLYHSETGIIDSLSQSYGDDFGQDGVIDTQAISELTLSLGRKLAAGKDIAAIGLCGTWHSIAACSAGMQPVLQTHFWNFMEPAQSCRALRADSALTQELYHRTGCMPHVTYPRHALLYLKENGQSFQGLRFISQGAYLFYRLTGVYCESTSTASGSGLLNIHTLDYDDFVLDLLGIQKSQLGRLVGYREFAPLTSEGAAALGIAAGIPVVPAHPDGGLNQAVSTASQSGHMTLSLGTSGAMRLDADRPVLPQSNDLWCYYGVDGWISGAATAGACNCINWFFDDYVGNKWHFKDLERFDDVGGSVPTFLPFLFGERCPGWHDDRLGGFYDLANDHTIRDSYRALQAGILFNLYQCYTVLTQEFCPPDDIILSGGILNSAQWTQMLADIFGREIVCMPIADASTLGAAMLALHAAGAIPALSAFDTALHTANRVLPRAEYADYYRAQYHHYLHWYEKTL
jgi:gluconokinase